MRTIYFCTALHLTLLSPRLVVVFVYIVNSVDARMYTGATWCLYHIYRTHDQYTIYSIYTANQVTLLAACRTLYINNRSTLCAGAAGNLFAFTPSTICLLSRAILLGVYIIRLRGLYIYLVHSFTIPRHTISHTHVG